MPKCNKCNDFYPSDMVDEKGVDQYLCHFCRDNVDYLIGADGTKYEKHAVLYEYKQFIEKMANNENIRQKATELALKKAIKESGV